VSGRNVLCLQMDLQARTSPSMEKLCKIWTLYVDLVDLLVSQLIFVHHEKPLSGFLSSSIKVILNGFAFPRLASPSVRHSNDTRPL